MKKELVCPEQDCESNTGGDKLFNMTAVFNQLKLCVDDTKNIAARHFECVHCGATAQEKSE